MRSDLLLRLADLLEADAAKPDGIKFDLRTWGNTNGFYPFNGQVPMDCGTTACAMGLAAISGIFADEGLTSSGGFDFTPRLETPEGVWWGFDSAKELFQINLETSFKLFSKDAYPEDLRRGADAEVGVAKRIRTLVAGGANALSNIVI